MTIVYISFAINILVAGFWGVILFSNSFPKLAHVFGPDSPSARILSSVYLTIMIVSVYALINQSHMLVIAGVLFPLQIIYKTLSAFSVRNLKNPIVISNLVIAVIHGISLYMLHL